MHHDRYGFHLDLALDFDEAVTRLTQALQAEGFGVLADIDVQATLKRKLGVAHPRYRILGACNPSFAHQALQAEPDIGLLLPCNVIVRETSAGVHIAFTDPAAVFQVVDRAELVPMVTEVRDRLLRAGTSLEGDG